MTWPVSALSRRAMLAGSLTPLLGALGSGCVNLKRDPVKYADTHVHLFNAHDLPVGLFLVDVLFRERNLPRALKAVIDTLVRKVQRVAMSAEHELRVLSESGTGSIPSLAQPPEATAADIAEWTLQPTSDEPPMAGLFADEADLLASYAELRDLVLADADGLPRGDDLKALVAEAPERHAAIVRSAFEQLARRAEGEGHPPGAKLERRGAQPIERAARRCAPDECPQHTYSMSMAAILRYLGWALLMLKSRESHLLGYARRASAEGERPILVINHLVDYDAWLGDERLPGSSHVAQVKVAAALATRYAPSRAGAPRLKLVNFAGFCPLKHALETLDHGRRTSLDTFLALIAGGELGGFKLYPPMGFMASNNRVLNNRNFDPLSSYRAAYFREWSRKFGADPGGHEIGIAIDAALEAFFLACETGDIPLMAHAGPGNEAGPGFGARANPKHWYSIAQTRKLRIVLGHLVNSAEDFVRALKGEVSAECVWSLGASQLLLDPTHALKATVYGDLGFMPELIEDRELAKQFFIGLRDVYGRSDPKLTRILYGSDFIMLATMRDHERHLSAMRAAMLSAGYGEEMIGNILVNNARRFLAGKI